MMSVLVIGAGIAGAGSALALAKDGVSVEVVEISPRGSAAGSGISLQGNALRVLRSLGVWDEVRDHGYGFDTLGLRAPDRDGTLMAELNDACAGGPDLPAGMGMKRPVLVSILRDAAARAGVDRLGSRGRQCTSRLTRHLSTRVEIRRCRNRF